MELKQRSAEIYVLNAILLIVPYGIETAKRGDIRTQCYLLIVPYGIETTEKHIKSEVTAYLLIVPYGIET